VHLASELERLQHALQDPQTATPLEQTPDRPLQLASTPEPPSRATIEAQTAALKEQVQEIGPDAAGMAWSIAEHGLTIGERGNALFTGGAADYGAPRTHPVWSDDLRHESHVLREMGEISPTRPYAWEYDFERWPPAFDANEARASLRQEPPRSLFEQATALQERLTALLQQVASQGQQRSRDQGHGLGM
jgi:hypothetical protein